MRNCHESAHAGRPCHPSFDPVRLFGQTVTLNGSPNVASAEDFASRVLQDPWDMNERTDFGWFLDGSDSPLRT